MSDTKPLASVSLDLDNLWTYLKTHGDRGWEQRPSYLAAFVPRVLDILDEHALTITFFVVGIDAVREENAEPLRLLVPRGHEVGNHSFEHEPWLHRYDQARLEDEITRAELAILMATGRRPVGFRGPGYSWSAPLLELLAARGYVYDASTLPTFIGPLARAYYFRTAKLSAAERSERAALFGAFRDGFRPIKAYRWELASGRTMLELPVTTFPGFRMPFHLSYLLYMSGYSERLMLGYLRAALLACRLTGVQPSFLLHPLDLLDAREEPRLAFFPGMDVPVSRKTKLFGRVMGVLREYFSLVPMGVHARALLGRGDLRVCHAAGPLAVAPSRR